MLWAQGITRTLIGNDMEELDKKKLNQDKKAAKDFKWFAKKNLEINITVFLTVTLPDTRPV